MKRLEFKTSKGVWCITDGYDNINGGIELKTITEEQASEVVDEPFDGFYPRYGNFEGGNKMWYCLKDKPIESLHSLLKSKGIHLYKNPLELVHQTDTRKVYSLNDDKTFYNPYIFKVV